jgi:16S rRNA (guanine(1405)-N(7))-methyltransferase
MARPDVTNRSDDSLFDELVGALADEVVRRYRIDRAAAVDAIAKSWTERPRLVAVIAASGSLDEVRRTRVYQDAAAAAKRDIYHRLRRYRSGSFERLASLSAGASGEVLASRVAEIIAAHVSTAERSTHLDEFLAALTAAVGPVRSVVDVGCGVLPLVYPLDGVDSYWALDRDRDAVGAVEDFARIRADGRLRPVVWDLADGWPRLFGGGLPRRCDVALLLKVVPVVARQSPHLLATLAAAPADLLVISGSRIAMAKRQDIERRETQVLQRFCTEYGLVERARFHTPDEICLVVERGN